MWLARSYKKSGWYLELSFQNPSLGLQTLFLMFFKQSRSGLLSDKISFMEAKKISRAILFGMLNLGLVLASSGMDDREDAIFPAHIHPAVSCLCMLPPLNTVLWMSV